MLKIKLMFLKPSVFFLCAVFSFAANADNDYPSKHHPLIFEQTLNSLSMSRELDRVLTNIAAVSRKSIDLGPFIKNSNNQGLIDITNKNFYSKHYQLTFEQALNYLSTHRELGRKLTRIARMSRKNIDVGPLIKNPGNQGLIDIDVPLDNNLPINQSVCGNDGHVTNIRDAVVCTINDGGPGNTDLEKIGKSTQGRDILAARMGNPNGSRVMIITQQHGNEVAGTEAALKVMQWLAFARNRQVKSILEDLDLLFIVRANPDGGEPDPINCAIDPVVGTVITEDCGLIRQNVDSSAGGALASDSEADFVGIVGRGYDLNRYHHVGLDKPIRPVENQAMVAAVLAFQPEVILDLHGDLPKSDCQLDYSSIVPAQVLGLLPTAECLNPDQQQDVRLLSPFADAEPFSSQEDLIQTLATNVMQRIEANFDGSVGRFSQVQLGAGNISSGASADYQVIGTAVGGWETVNFSPELRADVVAVVDGQPVISVNLGLPDPALLKQQIQMNRVALVEALTSLSRFRDEPPLGNNGFCEYPLASMMTGELPPKYWGPAATDGEVMIPISPDIGVPLYISGNCPDNPF